VEGVHDVVFAAEKEEKMSVSGSYVAVILCIDNNCDVLNMLEHILNGAGYKVLTAQDGGQGLAEARNRKPDLILLDVVMPKIDGFMVCSQLQNSPETAYIPVVFLTEQDGEEDRAKAFAAGAADYLAKPVQKETLLTKVAAQLKTSLHWQKLKEMVILWDGTVQPTDFAQFKQSLIDRLNLSPAIRDRLAWTVPLDIYKICEPMGIPRGRMTAWMADFLSYPLISKMDPASLLPGIIPVSFARENRVVAMLDANAGRSFILSNPFDWVLLDTMKKYFGLQEDSVLNLADPDNIDVLFGKSDEVSVAISDARVERPREIPAQRVGQMSSTDEETHHVVTITNNILSSAVSKRASVIHIEPKDTGALVRFRIDGDMRDVFNLQKTTAVILISRFKAIAGLDITGESKPQDGAVAAVIFGRTFKLRLATTLTPAGESLIIRLLETGAKARNMQSLGMTDAQVRSMIDLVSRKRGLLLIAGLSGSGKTTTIYSLLSHVDCRTRSLISVEDPVEYRIPFANQQQVDEKRGVTFDALLKSSVRQNHDMLYIGEVRDNYSARVAMDFSSASHLTISSLNTSNATTAIFCLERLGINRGMMADSIIGIVAQRLIKKICPFCRVIKPISDEERELLQPFTANIPTETAHPVGCPQCGQTGYFGREAVYEVIRFDPEVVEMVRVGEPISVIQSFIHKRGDCLISRHAVEKIRKLTASVVDVREKVLLEEA
jgi:type IV pilus assembly protein PilB